MEQEIQIVKKITPGLLLTVVIAWLSMRIQQLEAVQNMHFSSLIIAILLGILANNLLRLPSLLDVGIHFAVKKVLRLAIILLGFQLSLSEIGRIGGKGFLLVSIVTAATLIFTLWIGKKLGLDRDLSVLIGAGSSICGASAVAAVAPVIDAKERDTSFAIATVTLFGTIAMFLYPIAFRIFELPNLLYAVWAGSSIHEVGQVVAAGFAAGEDAGQFATLIKLSRVLLIIPAALLIGAVQMKRLRTGSESVPDSNPRSIRGVAIPWFVFGFLAVVLINSLPLLPEPVTQTMVSIDSFLLTIAMAGMGLETNFKNMRTVGMKPFYAGLLTTLFIAVLGFVLSALLFA